MQVTGKRTQFLDRLGIAVRGHTDPVCLSPHINAGGMRVDEGHMLEGGRVLLAFFRHTFLQSGGEREEQGKTGLLLRKDTRGGGERRDCFILIEPARSVGGTLTSCCHPCLWADGPRQDRQGEVQGGFGTASPC